jgi:hypothetical protein
MATVADYPSRTAVRWQKQVLVPPDFSASMSTHQFDDGGVSFNDAGGTILTFELTYYALTEAQCATLDGHYQSARLSNDFQFTDRYGTLHTVTRYKAFDKDFNQIGAQTRKVTLIVYP